MKKNVQLMMFFLALIVLFGLNSCQKSDLLDSSSTVNTSDLQLKKADMNTFYSPTQPIGNGVMRAWVQVDKMGYPKAVGVNLSEKALMNLPTEPAAYVLELPKTKGQNFYTHAFVDWNPHGHEPAHVYDTAHFDFHFYVIPNEERMQIPGIITEAPDPPYFDPAPADDYIPQDYMELPGLIPGMGAHWVDSLATELHGVPFTKTMIWGSYQGHFIFWEPMITVDFLKSHPDVVTPIKQPAAYEMPGWYASDYLVKYTEKPNQYTVALINLFNPFDQ